MSVCEFSSQAAHGGSTQGCLLRLEPAIPDWCLHRGTATLGGVDLSACWSQPGLASHRYL